MSQIGMQMPGGGRRSASMNIYTGLLALAVVALASACVFVYVQGGKIGKAGDPFTLQDPKAPDVGTAAKGR